jgi:ABC-type nitrate/sulfonate/bicarbonate transport system substrate-binding protein
MKKILSLLVVSLLVIAPQAFSLGKSDKRGGTPVRVVLDWTPNTNHSGLYAALKLGYFADEGLNVDIMQPPEDGAVPLVAAGGAEFGIDFQESLAPAFDGDAPLPVVAVAAIINHNTSALMSLRKKNITRPRDLQNKRFASWEIPIVTEIIKTLVEADGGNFSAVKMIPNNATDVFSALETDIDSVWIYYAWDGVAAEVLGKDIDYIDIAKLEPRLDFYTPVLLTNTAYAAKNPDTVKKFLRAASRGYNYCIDNPREAAAILLEYAPELNAELVVRSQQYLASRYQADAPRWGEIDGKRWGSFYKWMYEHKLLQRDISGEGFTNEWLP